MSGLTTSIGPEEIARVCHAGQVDRAGKPYIEHVQRVVERVRSYGPDFVAVAWLHDVREDSDYRWSDEGISPDVLAAVDLLTRKPGRTYREYIQAIIDHPNDHQQKLAVTVKIADVEDHLGPANRGGLGTLRERYEWALRKLVITCNQSD